ncbi:hypothetical protein ACFL21_05215 [Patescibacteria group bacterium]
MSKKPSIIAIISIIVVIIVIAILKLNFKESEPETFSWPFTFDETSSKLEIPLSEGCQLSYTQENISFNYACNWEVNSDERRKYPILITYYDNTPPGRGVRVELPAESFEEYEDEYKDMIQANQMSIRKNQLTINNVTYPVREYGQHGGLTYLLEIDGRYIKFGSEFALNQKEIESIYIILSSLKF